MICNADSCREYQYTIRSRSRDTKTADFDAISRGERKFEDTENHPSIKSNKSKHSKTAWGKVKKMISTRRDSLKKEPSDKGIDNTTISDKKRNSTGSTSTTNNSMSKM